MQKREFLINILYLIILSVIAPFPLSAATHTAASCSYEDVLAAYTAASAGDTIEIPTCNTEPITDWGSSSWIEVEKPNLTFRGQGVGKTIIAATNGKFFNSAVRTDANGLRIAGIEFRNASFGMYINNKYNESIQNLRIDHCKFYNIYTALNNYGHITGVIDNNIFEDMTGSIIRLFGDDDRDATFPFELGTSNALFFEDNVMIVNNNFPPHFITSRVGSRYVVRYNTFTYNKGGGWSATIDAHGTCEGSSNEQRGSFTWEVYENTFNGTQGANGKTFQFRGGQGVVFNNKITSYNTNIPFLYLDDYRIPYSNCYEGQCTEYPCRDQINNTYIWNNTFMGGPLNINSRDEDFIQNGRDYFLYEPAGGYTPYTYPHPLRKPSPPQNLRITSN